MYLTDTQLFMNYISKYQYGGIIDMDKIKKSFNRQTAQQDNTSKKPIPKLQPRQVAKDMFGRTVPNAPEQGTIHSPYNKSVRESLLSGLNTVDRDGKSEVAKIVTEPLKSGLRLLRPGKYFENVHSDADIAPALGSLGMDAATALPALEELNLVRKGLAAAPRTVYDQFSKVGRALETEKRIGMAQHLSESEIAANQMNNGRPTPLANIEHGRVVPQPPTAIDIGNKWTNDWISDPIIQDRMSLNNQQIVKHNELLREKGLPSSKQPLNTNIRVNGRVPSEAENNISRAYFDNNLLEHGELQGQYFHDHPGVPEGLRGKAFINPKAGDRLSTTVHETTHQYTDGNSGLSNQTERLLQSPFGGKLGIDQHIEEINKSVVDDPYWGARDVHGNTAAENHVRYLTNPTEIHARINELRRATGIKPSTQIAPNEIGSLMNYMNSESSPVESTFTRLIKDPEALRQLFNKMFTPAAVGTIGAGVALQPRTK